MQDYRKEQKKSGYPYQVTNSFINSADQLNKGLAIIGILKPGEPDFHCEICLSSTNERPPCFQSGIKPGYNPDRDEDALQICQLKAEQIITKDDFEKMYFSIFDKINASFYHLERLKENEEIAVQTGKELVKIKIPGTEGMVGIAGSPYEPIEYEYEAFLATIKSALDFVSILLAKGLNRKEDDIVSFTNNIQTNKTDPTTLKGKIYALLCSPKYKTFIDEYKGNKPGSKSKRNFATHQGSLPIGTINIPINSPTLEPLLSKALNPNDPDPHLSIRTSQNLVEYCEDQFYQACDLLIEILSLISDNKIEHGPKSSVYQERIDSRTKE